MAPHAQGRMQHRGRSTPDSLAHHHVLTGWQLGTTDTHHSCCFGMWLFHLPVVTPASSHAGHVCQPVMAAALLQSLTD
jgi:hypothetical protein